MVIVDRDGEKAEQTAGELGSTCMALQADVADGAAVQGAIRAMLARYGKLDAVHNNAGIAIPSKPLDQTTEAEWDELIRVNLKSVFWTTRYALDALTESKEQFSTRPAWLDLLDRTIMPHMWHDEGWPHRSDQGDGLGLRSERNSRERDLPCSGVDADAREVVRRAART